MTLKAMAVTAKAIKVEVMQFGVRSPNDFESAFAAMGKQRVDAVSIHDDPMLLANATAVAGLAVKHRIPSIGVVEFAEVGGLMAIA